MIHTLTAVGNSFGLLREGFAKLTGISGPQHELLMLIYRANDGSGVGVGELAGLVKLTSAFVATETNKLSALGLIEKVPDTVDRRRVTLHVTEAGRKRLALLSKHQREVNDTLFACFQSKDFLQFSQYLDDVLPCSERALRVLDRLVDEVERAKKAARPPVGTTGR